MRSGDQREGEEASLAAWQVLEQVTLEVLLHVPQGETLGSLRDQSVNTTHQIALADGSSLLLLQASIKSYIVGGIAKYLSI